MGIEKLYNQFNNTFNIVVEINENNLLENIDYLIFDFNSIIHNSIMSQNDINYDNNLDDIMINETLNNTINHIKNTIKQSNKIVEILIYFDGIPTINKINEQRKRKHIGKLEEILLNKKNNWSRNKISPGTTFMKKLENEIE